MNSKEATEKAEQVSMRDAKDTPAKDGFTRRPRSGTRVNNIMLLTDSFLPHAGGSREYYFNIYRELAQLGNTDVTVVTKKVPDWRDFDRKVAAPKFQIHRLFGPLSSWKYRELPKGMLALLHALWHVCLRFPDFVHAGDLYPPGVIAYLLRKSLGIPYLIYCHGEEVTQTDRFRYQPRLRNAIYRNADAVVANSEFARRQLLRIGVSLDRVTVITPGVDASLYRPMPPDRELSRLYEVEDKSVLLTVARLVPRKGHRTALKAMAEIKDDFPNLHYLIVGTGPEEADLRKAADKLGISDRVTFAGFVPAQNLPKLYNLCDIMFLLNRQEADGDVEGFGIVFLEAGAAGKPVIGGRSGGAVEAIEEGVTGCLVDPDDYRDAARTLRRLLSDSALRKRMGDAGRRRVVKEFDWGSRARLLEELNDRVCWTKRIATRARSNSEKDEVKRAPKGDVQEKLSVKKFSEGGSHS